MVPALLKQGTCLLQLHRYEEALPVYDTVLAQDPKEKTALIGLVEALDALLRPKEAFAASVRLTAADPKDAEAWFRRARLANAIRDGKEALAAMAKASGLAPERVDLLRFKRDGLIRAESYKAAVDVGERLLELDPRGTDALREMAVALEGIGEAGPAGEGWGRAARARPR